MKLRNLSLLSVVFCSVAICHAQKIDTSKSRGEMDKFVQAMTDDFNNFRRQSMEQFAEFVRNPWKEFEETKPIPKPNPKPVPPVIMDDNKDKPIEDNPIVIEEVVEPIIEEPQPQPVEPIEEVPVISPSFLNFTFFGTTDKVRLNSETLPQLKSLDERSVAAMLQELSTEDNDNLIVDCLEIRKNRKLSDWAYLKMLNTIANVAYPENYNEAQLLMAYLYLQSGYKMRLASDGAKLYMLFASKHLIYEKPSFAVDGDSYYGVNELPDRLYICQSSFPNEQSLSLLVNTNQMLTFNETDKRSIISDRYPSMKLDVSVNKNLLDFYSTYPTSALEGNIMTRWAMYANTPMDSNISTSLYPSLKGLLKDKSELEATNMLLNTLQTGLTYEYDDKVWGSDRAFFSEESLYYPYCDCEDRAILLTRLVRDILGLNCLLVYYPGHLAAAIEYSDDSVKGDYITLDGRKYVIADPTYINAPIGCTMPGMDNATAKVIKLN